jgi:hypothetical protein
MKDIFKLLQTYTLVRSFLIVCVFTTLLLGSLFILTFPALEDAFTDEKMFLEVLTIFLYGLTFVVALETRKFITKHLVRSTLLFLLVYSCFWFLEESSYGRDMIYRFPRPEIYGMEIDSVHDFVGVYQNMLTDYRSDPATLIVSILLVLAVAYVLYQLYRIRTVLLQIAKTQEGTLIVCSLVFIAFAAILDLDLLGDTPQMRSASTFLEELTELFAALAVVYSAVAVRKEYLVTKEK